MSTAPQLDRLEATADDTLGALIAAAEQTLAGLERRRAELSREIDAHTRKLRAWRNARDSLGRTVVEHLRVVSDARPTKREAVLAFLSERPDENFKLVDIRRALIKRGLMTNDQAHALEVAVRDMETRGEIRRPGGRKGIYTLRPPEVVDDRD